MRNATKTILIIVPSLKKTGPNEILYSILKYLDTKKIEIHIIALKKIPTNQILDFKKINSKIKIQFNKYPKILLLLTILNIPSIVFEIFWFAVLLYRELARQIEPPFF